MQTAEKGSNNILYSRKKHQRRQWQPTPVLLLALENPMDGGAW